MIKKIVILLFFLIIFKSSQSEAFAKDNQFINIVNPVRISSYTVNITESLKAQYEIVKNNNLSSTWIVTYDVINNSEAVKILKNYNNKQELGIFLEVTQAFAKKAGVKYNASDGWFRSKSLFLIGYTKNDREKLIDTIFNEFKDKFGYYPTSVGAWWIDSYSLHYMESRYKITATINCSDQFMTDSYSIWGQYWSTPFYPSLSHAGIPASNISNKINVVTIQWAPRDPLNGYIKGSRYSTQDYHTLNIPDTYFEKLIDLYTNIDNNQFGQITVGLEGDFPKESYSNNFKKQIEIVKAKAAEKNLNIVTMKEFSKWYMSRYPELSPSHVIISNDLLGGPSKVIWYQSPFYRILVHSNEDTTQVLDFRSYPQDIKEPYLDDPNDGLNLFIRIPYLIDFINDKNEKWAINNEKIKNVKNNTNNIEISFNDEVKLTLSPNNIFFNKKIYIPDEIKNSNLIDFNEDNNSYKISPKSYLGKRYSKLEFNNLSPAAVNFLKRKKAKVIIITVPLLFLLIIIKISSLSNIGRYYKIFFISFVFLIHIIALYYWFNLNSIKYFVSQEEVLALEHLKTKTKGKIVVVDSYCLVCNWKDGNVPATMGNHRNYVESITNMPIIYSSRLFNPNSREEAKKELQKLNVKYIYLTQYGFNSENIPYSPGDIGVELIFENAHAQIWKVI